MTAPKPRGACPVCDELHRTTKAGSVMRHTGNKRGVWPPESCDGTGRPAADQPPETTEEIR